MDMNRLNDEKHFHKRKCRKLSEIDKNKNYRIVANLEERRINESTKYDLSPPSGGVAETRTISQSKIK